MAGPDADTYDAGAAERFVTDYVATNDIAGAAYVVVEDGAVVVTGAAGTSPRIPPWRSAPWRSPSPPSRSCSWSTTAR
ncbi:hypothetical protein [Serinicoccus hydrothermalis]|uniref:hypothetical protein n=1 Tax=Serinicoccus hydrothermalis TaxID=1758689 RepID=UPI001F2B1C43|nr:hypothetical protein [Serinicoccus hydrothermalis]